MAFLKIDSPALNQSAPSWETVVEINSEDGWIMQKKSFFFSVLLSKFHLHSSTRGSICFDNVQYDSKE